jgi:hypothetical protein
MRILGLIAGFAVVLSFTGLALFQRHANPNHKERNNVYLDQLMSRSFPREKKNDQDAADSSWKFLQMGLSHYPDFGTFDFLTKTK